MGFRCYSVAIFVIAVIIAGAPRAHAQTSSWGDLSVSAARIDFDLSGVGTSAGVAVRATRDLSSNVSVEAGGLFAKPDQQFGPSTLFIPEALLRYRWQAGRFAPYVGGGLGAALVTSSFGSNWDPTIAMAVGTGVRLTDRLGVNGEFRLRGHQWRFTGTTAEISAGLTWRLPAL